MKKTVDPDGYLKYPHQMFHVSFPNNLENFIQNQLISFFSNVPSRETSTYAPTRENDATYPENPSYWPVGFIAYHAAEQGKT